MQKATIPSGQKLKRDYITVIGIITILCMASSPMLYADPGNNGNPLTGLLQKLDEILLAIQNIEYPSTMSIEDPVEVTGIVDLKEGAMVEITNPILPDGGTVNIGNMVEVMGTVELGDNRVEVTNLDEITLEAGTTSKGDSIHYADSTGYGPWLDISGYETIYIHMWAQGEYRLSYVLGMESGETVPRTVSMPTDLGDTDGPPGYYSYELPVTSTHIRLCVSSLEAQQAMLNIYIYGKPN